MICQVVSISQKRPFQLMGVEDKVLLQLEKKQDLLEAQATLELPNTHLLVIV